MEHRQIIIAFSGPMGSGKDTYATELLKIYPDAMITSFAKALKIEATDVIGLYHAGMYDQIAEYLNIETNDLINLLIILEDTTLGDTGSTRTPAVRKLLQTIGTEIRRKQDPKYWIKQLERNIVNSLSEIVIITDARFHNELECVTNFDKSIVFKLHVTPEEQAERIQNRDGFTPTNLSHASENDFKNFDHENVANVDTSYPIEYNVDFMHKLIEDLRKYD